MCLLKDCGPAALSVELTCLASEGGGVNSLLLAFIHMIDSMLTSGRDFELAHAYLALFLKVSQWSTEESQITLTMMFWAFFGKIFAQFSVYHQFSVFVFQLHLRSLTQDSIAMAALLHLSNRLEVGWAELRASFDQSLCLLSYAKSALL